MRTLPMGFLGISADEEDGLRAFEAGEPFMAVLDEVFRGLGCARIGYDEGADTFSPLGVGDADDGGFPDSEGWERRASSTS